MRKILLFLMLISANYANSQPVSDDTILEETDTLCIHLDHYKIILAYAYRGKACDSLITTYDTTIHNLEEIIKKKDVQLQLTSTVIEGQAVTIKRLRWLSIGLGSGVGILTLLYLIK